MTLSFSFRPTPEDTELTLTGPDGPVSFERWAAEAPASLRPGVDLALRLEAASSAVTIEDTLFIRHSAVAALTAHEASLLGLPAAANAAAAITTRSVVTQSNYGLTLRWQRPTGQALGVTARVGAWLRIGDDWCRLLEPLYAIAEAVDAMSKAGDDAGSRLSALASLIELLPGAQQDGAAVATGMLGQIKIHVADAFSLDLRGEGEGTRLMPVLHRAGGDFDAPLLPEPLQEAFAQRHFYGFADARTVYPLGNGNMLVLSPPPRRAVSAEPRSQSAPPATRRAVFTNPRLYLRDALGDDSETLVENVFRDTPAYSERVIGLGLWQKRVVPWVQVAATKWFDGAPPDTPNQPPDRGGVMIDGQRIALAAEEADDLRSRIEQAIGAGDLFVEISGPDGPVRVPANHDTLTALAQLEAARARKSAADLPPVERPPPPEVLLIHPNEETLEVEMLVARRPTPPQAGVPALCTPPKQHQSEGLAAEGLGRGSARGIAGGRHGSR